MTYLIRGVDDIAVAEPTAHRTELGLVLKRILEGDGVSRGRFPLNKFTTLGKPFSVNIRVELDLMGILVVGNNLDTKVRERNRLIHEIRRLCLCQVKPWG